MAAFTWADYIIIGIIGFSIVISLIRGFVREALSLVTWIAAFWIAFKYASDLAEILTAYISSATLRFPAALFILFAGTLIVGSIINYVITQLVERTGLSGTDRILGMAFGFMRGVLLIALLLLMASLSPLPKSQPWQASLLIPYFMPLEEWLAGYMPHTVDTRLINSQ